MTNSSSIANVAIVGGGLMGRGIAEVCALRGLKTTLIKASGKGADSTRERIEKSLSKAAERGKVTGEAATNARANLVVTGDRACLAGADLVVESVVEDLTIKKGLFAEVAERAPARCILASNTSTLRISDLAPEAARERTIGLHFFSPVPAMALVELAYLDSTEERV